MLFMIEKCIRGGICQAIHQCAGCNNEYMVDYSNNKVPLYPMKTLDSVCDIVHSKLVWMDNVTNGIQHSILWNSSNRLHGKTGTHLVSDIKCACNI